jgi:hypothetical protein
MSAPIKNTIHCKFKISVRRSFLNETDPSKNGYVLL